MVSGLLIFSITALAGPVGTLSGFEDDDGNLVDNATAGIDWNSFSPTTWTGTAPNRTATKTALGWQFLGIEDAQAVTSDTGFAGGTKQDANCASVIASKAPNKDDMKRAYLSTMIGTSGAGAGHVFLNLAWVRIPQNTTSSSAHIGFEFNKGSIACAGPGGLVNRTAGDMLIVYDFEGGSGDPVLTLRRWVTSGSCEVSSNSPPCWGTATNLTAGGFAEARVNVGASVSDTISPTSPASETLNDSEFGEAGIDLTAAGVFTPGSCESFGKVFAVSRSSGNSGTAQMKDLVGPAPFSIGSCTATITTTPSVGAGTEVSPGDSVTDLAVVQGANSAGTPPTPTGNVTFFLCGPIASGVCSSGGTQVGSPVALANSAPPPGEASATSAAVNTAANPLAPGRYCFRATWPGDSNYTGPFSHAGTGNSECFVVRQIATTTVTTPSNGLGSPLSSPVDLGTVLFDKAVVTGTAVGGNPPGTVDFFICDPSQVQGAAGAETCPNGFGTALSGNPRTLAADLASNPPTSSVLSSPGVTADKAGVWCFRAVYTPTGNTYTGSSDATHGECVTVSKAPTTTTTTPRNGAGDPVTELAVGDSLFDSAVVQGVAAGGTPTGTVDFFICDPSQVQGSAGSETCATGGTALAGNPRTLSADAGSDPPSASVTSSPAVVVDEVGTWCFRAEFTPGGSNAGNYLGSSDSSHSECVVVKDSTSTASEQTWLPNDSATVTSAGGTALNGTLSFTLYSGGDCSGTILRAAEEFTLTDEPSPATRSTTNTDVTVDDDATVSWKVVFDSSSDLVADSEHCEKTTLDITN
jgi:hypothetical protein